MTTATHIAYYHLCHRKLWLFHHGIRMEHESDLVLEGKNLHQSSYANRAERWQEIALEGVKIDYYDIKAGIVHEIKKSKRKENAHVAQVQYYLYVLEQYQLPAQYALLEYPKLRQTTTIYLDEPTRQAIPQWLADIQRIVAGDCPAVIQKPMCKKCAYYEFCYVGEI